MAVKLDELAGEQGGEEGRKLASHWLEQLNTIKDNSEHKRWVKRGEDIEKRYRDERNRTDQDGQRRYNSLWSNVEILKPALYGKTPLPIAERRFKDKDPSGRGASQILERALRNEVEICGFNEAMQQVVGDYLLPGRGVAWVRYEPQFGGSVSLPVESQTDMLDSDNEEAEGRRPGAQRPRLTEGEEESGEGDEAVDEEHLESTGDQIVRESTPVDYVPWKDFFVFPARARVWAEVTAVGKRVHFSRNQSIERFGREIGRAIPVQRDDRGTRTQNTTLQSIAEDKHHIYEIWDRDTKQVLWIAEGYEYLCDRQDDPLNLELFFPCPKPLFANPTNNTLTPVPDYIQYQDQAVQIDELTARIAMLCKACKVAGVYNAAAKDIQRLLDESVENQLIPVDDWAAFAEGGGVAGNIALLPLKEIQGVINELSMVKAKLVEELDRVTGITDIMRGTTDARETFGGQRLKTNSSGTRLTSRQNEVARFARDLIRIMAGIMCQHFSPQSLIEASGALYEEGLGPDDMPSLTQLQSPPAPPQAGPMPGQPPGMPPGMPQGGPPQAPMGQNVVPFRPQGPPGVPPQPGSMPPQGMPPGPPQGIPPGGPQALTGQVLPPLPPEAMAQLQAAQRIAKAIQLLRNQRLRGFRVDIEVDSTIYPDAAQDKQDRTEFIVAVTGYLEKAMMMGGQMPDAIPLLGKLLQFGVRGHRVGRDLEVAVEEFCDQAIVTAKQRAAAAANQPNPEQIKQQTEVLKAHTDLQVEQTRAQSDKLRAQADIQNSQIQAASEQKQAQAEVARQQVENQGEQQNAQADMEIKRMDMEMRLIEKRMEEMRMQLDIKKMEHEAALADVEQETAMKMAKQKSKEQKSA